MRPVSMISESDLTPPPGSGIPNPRFRPRVLRRDDDVGDNCPLIRSAPGFRTIPQGEWRTLIGMGVNMSALVWSVFNQAQVGSCASESADGALKIVREGMGQSRVEYNPYGTYGRVNGGSDRGSTLGANLKFKRDVGSFVEKVWPRSKGWRATPSEEAYEAAWQHRLDEYYEITNWAEFGSALLQGWIVYWGYSGHAIVGADLINEEQFIFLNSWGNWGSSTEFSSMPYGFGVINRSRIMWSYGVYGFRTAVVSKDDPSWIWTPDAEFSMSA